ncbi:hypothetical protein ILUMI_19702, partial [Ignelater luminosus]
DLVAIINKVSYKLEFMLALVESQIIYTAMAYKLEIPKSIYRLVRQLPKRQIVNLFRDQGISPATIYRTIPECEQGIPCLNLPKTGRPKALSTATANRLIQTAKNRVGASNRKLARRFGTSYATVRREIKNSRLKYRKRRKCPKYTQDQLARIPLGQNHFFIQNHHYGRRKIFYVLPLRTKMK